MSIRPSYRGSLIAWVGVWLVLMLSGCARPGGVATTRSDDIPILDSGRSRILAWVPRQQAATASAAQTAAYIALVRAKRATESELCHGTWIFAGKPQQEVIPQLAAAPARMGGFNGWHLRIAWEPQLAECGVSAQTYAHTLSKHLPTWMLAQAIQSATLFHRGEALLMAPTTLALRGNP